MNKFNSKSDIERFVSDRLPDDLSVYTMTIDEMIDTATNHISDYMHDLGFAYGKEMPSNWFEKMYGYDHSKYYELFE